MVAGWEETDWGLVGAVNALESCDSFCYWRNEFMRSAVCTSLCWICAKINKNPRSSVTPTLTSSFPSTNIITLVTKPGRKNCAVTIMQTPSATPFAEICGPDLQPGGAGAVHRPTAHKDGSGSSATVPRRWPRPSNWRRTRWWHAPG